MGKGEKGSYKSRQKQKQLLCTTLTLTLISIIIVLAVLYFLLFKPKDSQIKIPTMQLLSLYIPNYSVASSAISALNVTLNLQLFIENPNRAIFNVQNGSKARLYYDSSFGQEAGYSSVPEGAIAAKSSTILYVPLSNFQQGDGEDRSEAKAMKSEGNLASPSFSSSIAGIMEMGLSVTIMGKVTTLGIFSHHSVVVCKCGINLSFVSRGIESYTCQRSISLDALQESG